MDPVVWIWCTILSVVVLINLVIAVRNARRVWVLIIAGSVQGKTKYTLAYTIDVMGKPLASTPPPQGATGKAALDNISTLAAAVFCAYLFIQLVRYGWKKRPVCCVNQFPKGFY